MVYTYQGLLLSYIDSNSSSGKATVSIGRLSERSCDGGLLRGGRRTSGGMWLGWIGR